MAASDRPHGDARVPLVRVFVVDDHPIVRKGLVMLIAQQPDMELAGEAESAEEALKGILRSNVDVVVADVFLKDSSGIELVRDLQERRPALPVLLLSMHDEALYAERALRAGARGYLMKIEPPERIVTAVRDVLRGQICVSPTMTTRMLSRLVDGENKAPATLPLGRLSDREIEVFELIGQGLGTRKIADKLHLSVKTVEAHRAKIKRKLKLPDSSALMRQAFLWVQGDKLP